MNQATFTAEPGKQEIRMTRTFDAPRDKVFKAFIDPEAIPQWWGPSILTTQVDKLDAKQGGLWRFVQRDPEGNVHAFHGVYHSVKENESIVYTFEYEGMPGHVLLETVKFEDRNGQTFIDVVSVFQSQEARDGMLQTDAEAGAKESYDRLEKYLATKA